MGSRTSAAAAGQPAHITVTTGRNDTALPSFCNSACVVFYGSPNYNVPPQCGSICGGIAAAFTTSQRDLSGWAVAGQIGSIQLAGVGAIAVYSGTDFGGFCQTITENMPTLFPSNIRGDFIKSFAINATCEGPLAAGVSPLPVLADVVTLETSAFPNATPCSFPGPVEGLFYGWVWRWGDLNAGTSNGIVQNMCLRFSGDPFAQPYDPVLVTDPSQPGLRSCQVVSPFGAPQRLSLCGMADPGVVTVDLRSVVVPHGVDENQRVCSYAPLPNFGLFFEPTNAPNFCVSVSHVIPAESGLQACQDDYGADWTVVTQPGGAGLSDINRGIGDDSVYLCALQVNVGSTPPAIAPKISGSAGSDGWYRSTVQVSWNVSGGAAGSDCSPSTISQDTTGITLTCHGANYGVTSSRSVTIKRDTTPPVVHSSTATDDRLPYTPGTWTSQDVTVTFTCTDGGAVQSGIATSGNPSVTLSSEGANRSAESDGTCADTAGNTAAVARVSGIDIDKTAPLVTVTGVGDLASYVYGNVPQAGCHTSDALSGTQTNATLTLTQLSGAPAHTGSFKAACAGAVDRAGNATKTISAQYTVTPAPLMLTARDQSRVFGDPNPACQLDGDGFISPDTLAGLSGTLSCDLAGATSGSPVGDYTITPAGLSSPDYRISYRIGTLHVTAKPTGLQVATPSPVQYSDLVTLAATVSGYSAGGTTGGGSVSFAVNGVAVCGASSQPVCPVPNAGGVATLQFAELALGPRGTPYSVQATYTPTNSNFTGSGPASAAGGLSVGPEDARLTYSGPTTVWTPSPASTSATVQLSATLRDISAVSADPASDGYPGDIRTATLQFVDRAHGNAVLCTPSLDLVIPTDSTTATAGCSTTVSLGSQTSLTLQLGLVVGGNYRRDAQADETTLTIGKARSGASVIAAGALGSSRAAGGLTGGSQSAAVDVQLRASYTAGATAPSGSLTLQIVAGSKRYTVIVNRFSMVGEHGRQAVVQGSATIVDTTSVAHPVLVDGAASVQVALTGTGANSGTIALNLVRADGSLAFASAWDGAQPVELSLQGTVVVS